MSDRPELAPLIDELVSIEREAAALAARQVRLLAAIHACELADRAAEQAAESAAGRTPSGHESMFDRERHWVSEEVGLVLRVAGIIAQDRLLHAHQLVTRLPAAVALLAAGDLHPVQAQRLSDAVIGLTDSQCNEVSERVLAKVASNPHLSITQFTRSVKRAVIAAAPKTADQAHSDALGEARVEVRPIEHGMALLLAVLAAPDALRIKAAIDNRARLRLRSARRTGDATSAADSGSTCGDDLRDADRRRACALVELIDLGADADPAKVPSRPAPAVQVTVALSTLAAADEQPADLSGYGPIPAALARRIAADPTSTWRRLVTDPLGTLADYGRTRYKPPPDLDAFVRARDQTCAFPNCNRRAVNCELDHVQPWSEHGETCAANLVPSCARHHHLRHDGGWDLERDQRTGAVTWTSPTGRTYRNELPELPGARPAAWDTGVST